MTTITILAGNTDNKLTQQEWAEFVQQLSDAIRGCDFAVTHFFGAPSSYSHRQNVCWVVELEDGVWGGLKSQLINLRQKYRQDSLATIVGDINLI